MKKARSGNRREGWLSKMFGRDEVNSKVLRGRAGTKLVERSWAMGKRRGCVRDGQWS